MRVDVRINPNRQYYIAGDSFRTTAFHDMSHHIIGKHLETLINGTDIDMVIVRDGYPDIAYRIYNNPHTKKIYLDMNSRVLN